MKTKIWGCILGAVMFASALQSCQTQVEIPDGAVYPILFGSTETRAVADLDDLKTNGFKVYAYFQGNVGGSASFANNVKHAVVEGLDVWSFETPEYWIPNTNYWFKAVYPGGIGNVDNDSSEQTFTISDLDISKQQDVMVATATASVAENATAPASGSVVNLTFHHLLANVVIAIKSEISGVIVKSVSLHEIAQTGSYDETKAIPWSSTQTTSVKKENINITLTTGQNEYSDVTAGGFLVIPQVVKNKELSLSIVTSNKNYTIAIPDITWEVGVQYIYTLTIQQNDIIFDLPTIVEEWDEKNATGSVIIK